MTSNMTDKEKRKLARKLLGRAGYSDKDVKKIVKLSFDKKKDD